MSNEKSEGGDAGNKDETDFSILDFEEERQRKLDQQQIDEYCQNNRTGPNTKISGSELIDALFGAKHGSE